MATAALEEFEAGAAEEGRRCGICQTAIVVGEKVGRCPGCDAPFHRECWQENGGCATYGCAQMPETVKAEDPLAPKAFWGQEEKTCPSCGQNIKAAALRCRHCGTVFEDRAPVSQEQFESGAALADRRKALGQQSVALFVLGIIPLTSPVALTWGAWWLMANRRDLPKLEPMHRVLSVLGMIAAVASVTILALGLIIGFSGSNNMGVDGAG